MYGSQAIGLKPSPEEPGFPVIGKRQLEDMSGKRATGDETVPRTNYILIIFQMSLNYNFTQCPSPVIFSIGGVHESINLYSS